MRLMLKLLEKELRDQFRSPFFYALSGIFILLVGVLFFNVLVDLVHISKNIEHMGRAQFDFATEILKKTYGNINFLFIIFVPVFTMGIFSDEKKSGTLDLLLSSALKEWQIVIAKYVSAFLMVMSLLALCLIFPLSIFISGHTDWSTLLSCNLALMLNVSFLTGLGIFFSSIYRSAILSGISTMAVIFFLWVLSWLSGSIGNQMISEIFTYLGLMTHFNNLMYGRLYLSGLTYYFCGIVFLLYFTTTMIKSQRWK